MINLTILEEQLNYINSESAPLQIVKPNINESLSDHVEKIIEGPSEYLEGLIYSPTLTINFYIHFILLQIFTQLENVQIGFFLLQGHYRRGLALSALGRHEEAVFALCTSVAIDKNPQNVRHELTRVRNFIFCTYYIKRFT